MFVSPTNSDRLFHNNLSLHIVVLPGQGRIQMKNHLTLRLFEYLVRQGALVYNPRQMLEFL
jgi:hypothetical protein